MATRRIKIKRATRYEPDMLWKIYELARDGLADNKIMEVFHISTTTFRKWKENNPEIQEALDKARELKRKNDKNNGTFADYVYSRLPDDLKEVWDKINLLDTELKYDGQEQINAIMEEKGKLAQQNLFVYALVHSNFNPSEACRKCGITKTRFDKWMMEPDFAALVDEIHWHKKNFFEGALIGLVKSGDSSAIMFVNRTINRDRGYTEKLTVENQHTHTHVHGIVAIDSLGLDLETRKKLLDAINPPVLTVPEPRQIEEGVKNETHLVGENEGQPDGFTGQRLPG